MNKEIAIKWYKQAKHDLDMAEKNISIGGYDISAFLSQQAVEKLLKAIFAIENQKISHSHYIDDLANKLKMSEDILEHTYDLTPDYTFARYPDVSDKIPYEEYTEEIAREKVKIAKMIFQKLRKRYEILDGEK